MAKAKQYLNEIFVVSGIKTSEGEAKNFLDKVPEDLEIPDEVANAYKSSIYTKESALNNSDIVTQIKGQAKAEIFNGLDQELSTVMEGLSEDAKQSVLSEKSSFKRIGLITNALNSEFEKKLAAAGGDTSKIDEVKTAYENQLATLRGELTERDSKIQSIKNEYAQTRINDYFNSSLARETYADKYGQEDGQALAKIKLNADMEANKLRLIESEHGKIELVQMVDDQPMKYFVDNKEMTFDNYVKSKLTVNKLISVNQGKPQVVRRTFDEATLKDNPAAAFAQKALAAAEAQRNGNG